MDSHHGQGFFGFEPAANLATDQRNGFILWSQATKSVNCELAIAGGKFCVRDFFDESYFRAQRWRFFLWHGNLQV